MALIVQKFGGSCLYNDESVKNAARIIVEEKKKGNDVIAVVSAQGNTTDILLEKALRMGKNPSKRELDVIMSAGEQLSASLLSIAVEDLGYECVSLLGWQAGIKTNSSYGFARVKDIDTSRIKKELSRKKIVVIAGFQGLNEKNDMTTLGRGGSDTTAVSLAAAMKAEKCQIFSKIDGIYTADPEKVEEAKKLKEIQYEAMQELAFLGVKVLNPRAVELAHKYDVVIEVKSAFIEGDGTFVKESVQMEKMLISGVTKQTNLVQMTVSSVENKPGTAFNIFGILAKENINVDIIMQTEDVNNTVKIVFLVGEEEVEKATQLLENRGIDSEKIEVNSNIAKVSVVGLGIESHPGVAAAIFEALSEKNINISLISSSELRFSVVVNKDVADDAVKAIHKRFINI
ncbi:MAG: aspartate kinase [Clostridia bacterium]|nr:aspartate kinase [Clostridia bacterium]MBR3934675.1 aspartate kinase [Clostridia bacterium]